MNPLVEYWPILVVAAGTVIWAIRQEGRLNNEQEARRKVESDLSRFYATKEEVVRLEGAISVVANQLPDVKALLVRIEGKVDSFLVAAVRQQGSRTVRGDDRS